MGQIAKTPTEVGDQRKLLERLRRVEMAIHSLGSGNLEPGSIQKEIIGSVDAETIEGQIIAEQIGSINADQIIGQIEAAQINSIEAVQITGSIEASQIGSVNAIAIEGSISAGQIGSVSATTITGSIDASQIETVFASSITGSIDASKIGSVNAAAITGSIDASQIGSVNASSIAGDILASQIDTVNAGDIAGSIIAAQISSVNAAAIAGSITSGQISSVNAASISGGITSGQISSVAAASITGGIVSGQISSVAAASITGTITSVQIASVSAAVITGSITSGQIGSVAASVITGSIGASQIGSVNASAITGSIGASQIGSVNAAAITGSIAAGQIGTVNAGAILTPGGLADIDANLGSITAGTITGALFRSAASGQRYEADNAGIRLYDSTGAITFHADTSTGKITTLAGIGGPNMVADSGFETGAATVGGWVGGRATLGWTTSQKKYGTRAVSLTANVAGIWDIDVSNTNNRVPVEAGKTYALSAYFLPATTTRSVRVALYWWDAGGQLAGDVGTTVSQVAGVWTRATHSATAPPTAVTCRAVVQVLAVPLAEVHYVDAVQLEEGALPTAYGPKPDEILPNAVGSTEIAAGAVSGGGGTGEIAAGTIVNGDIVSIVATKITGSIIAAQIGSVNATAITGSITSTQIGSVNATAITGSITSGQIGSVAATTITGSIISGQIGSVNATAITGSITSGQISSVNATAITGSITATQIGSVNVAAMNAGGVNMGGANLVSESSFETVGMPGWRSGAGTYFLNSGGSITRITSDFWHGGASCEVVTTAASAFQGVERNGQTGKTYRAGQSYAFSIWIKSVSGSTALQLFVGDQSGNSTQTNITATTSWVRYSTIWTPSADVTAVYIGVRTNSAAASTFRIDAVQLEEGNLVTAYGPREDEILPLTINSTHISSVNATSISGSITSGQIGSVAATTITGSITSTQIGSVTAGVITGSIIATQIGSVNAAAISGPISAGQITSITAGQITGSIVAGQIGSVTAGVINVGGNGLAAISADLGIINAGTVTGAVFQTSSNTSLDRIVIDTSSLSQFIGTTKTLRINKTMGIDLLASTFALDPDARAIMWYDIALDSVVGSDTEVAGLHAYRGIVSGHEESEFHLAALRDFTGDAVSVKQRAYMADPGGAILGAEVKTEIGTDNMGQVKVYAKQFGGAADVRDLILTKADGTSDFQQMASPRAKIYATVATSLANITSVTITLGGVDTSVNDANYAGEGAAGTTHTATANQLTCRKPGLYLIVGQLSWTGNTTGGRRVTINVNGTTVGLNVGAGLAQTNAVQVVAHVTLAAGDAVTMQGFQNSGATLTSGTGVNTTYLSFARIGE